MLNNALQFALKSGDCKEQFSHDKDAVLFSETLAFHGKDKIMNLLQGPGFNGLKNGGTNYFQWKDWNLPFVPSKSTRNKEKVGYTTKWHHQESPCFIFVNRTLGRKWSGPID